MTTDQVHDPDLELGDEPYDSAEDEDFQLDAVQDEGSDVSSESETEGDARGQPAKKKRKTGKNGAKEAGDEEELDSGDEVTIQKAQERKKKKQKGKQGKDKGGDEEGEDVDFDEDEEGGTGGFVRTRAMKMRTYVVFGTVFLYLGY